MQLRFILFIYFLLLVPIVFPINLFGQTLIKEYRNEEGEKTTVMDSAIYYEEGVQNAEGKWEGEVKTYDLTNKLTDNSHYKNGKLDGESISYYKNGNMHQKTNWQNGDLIGMEYRWYKNGQKNEEREWVEPFVSYKVYNYWDSTGKQTVVNGTGEVVEYMHGAPCFRETYKKGNLVKGISYGENNKEYPYTIRHTMPEFPGGIAELMRYLGKNIRYPSEAYKNNIYGKVVVAFVIGRDGKVKDITTTSPRIGYGLEEEAVRVIANMPLWKPGIQDGRVVAVRYSLPVNFNY